MLNVNNRDNRDNRDDRDKQEDVPCNFSIHNVFVKDVSFEAPKTPKIFSLPWKPKVDFDLEISSTQIGDNLWEVILNVATTVVLDKSDANKNLKQAEQSKETAFIVEVKQAGIFSISGFTAEQTDRILGTTVPNVLFPYVREIISGLVSKGGFPQLVLPPINFDGMYEQRKLEKNKSK